LSERKQGAPEGLAGHGESILRTDVPVTLHEFECRGWTGSLEDAAASGKCRRRTVWNEKGGDGLLRTIAAQGALPRYIRADSLHEELMQSPRNAINKVKSEQYFSGCIRYAVKVV